MSRRAFLLGSAGALSGLLYPARAQQTAKARVVGVLVTHAAVNDPTFEPFRAGLRDFGFEEGRNIKLEILTAEGQLDRLPGLAQELVRQKVDVIISPNEVSARAALKATTIIPIVLTGFAMDPVRSGLVDSFARPGGNVTGLYAHYLDLDGKLLQLLKELLPGASRVAAFRGAEFASPPDELQHAARSLRVTLELTEVRGPTDLESAFKGASRMKADAVMLLAAPIFYAHRARAAKIALEERLPTISSFNQFVEAGGLISYGADLFENWKRAAYYVDRLLKGAKPSDLPIEQVSKLKLAVNLKTARTLGIKIPQSIMVQADEVIR